MYSHIQKKEKYHLYKELKQAILIYTDQSLKVNLTVMSEGGFRISDFKLL